ncbi:MAG: thermonuclease family protein [Pyrinomonadaceae bacterium]
MRLSIGRGRLLFAVIMFVLAAPSFGQDLTAFTGRVTAVSEGDVIVVADAAGKQHKVRLAAIDAPEMGQEYGAAAKNFLIGLVLNQPVTVVGRRRDDDGRLVAQVFLLGRDVSYSMLWAGLAWHDKDAGVDQTKDDRKQYAKGEKFARDIKNNIWSQSKPVPPWDFRKDNPRPKESQPQLTLTQMSQPIAQPAPAPPTAAQPVAAEGSPKALEIVGNKQSKIYHWNPGCPGFSKIAEKNRIPFASKAEAEAAGYRPAKNCKQQ